MVMQAMRTLGPELLLVIVARGRGMWKGVVIDWSVVLLLLLEPSP